MYSIEEFEKEKAKVMNYIMYKKRTIQEVKNKFQSTIQKDLLCDIIEYVKEAGYLNEKDYVKRAVNEFMALKTLSIREMQYKLYQKGVPKDLIEDYFYEYTNEMEEYEKASAQKIVGKKQATLENEEIRNYLMKKGYKERIIKEVLECKTY